MKRRNFIVTTALLAAVAFAPTACKKDGGAGGASGATGDMLSFLPKDSTGVVGISWSKARSSSLFKTYEKELLANIPGEVEKIKTECGIDLLADINTFVVAVNSNPDNSIIAIKGAFDQAKVEGCVTKMGGTVDKGAYTIDGQTNNAHWASKDTMLMSQGLTAEKIKSAASAGSLKDNSEIMGLVGKVDTSATVWAAGMIPKEAAGAMGAMGGKPPKSAYLSLSVDSGLSAKVGLVFESGDEANAIKGQLDMVLGMGKGQPELKDIIEGVSANVDGSSLVVKAKLSGKQLDKLKGMAGGMPF